jgi:DNA recombination protein RmuC
MTPAAIGAFALGALLSALIVFLLFRVLLQRERSANTALKAAFDLKTAEAERLRVDRERALLAEAAAQGQLMQLPSLQAQLAAKDRDLQQKESELRDAASRTSELDTRLQAEKESFAREFKRLTEVEVALKESFKALSHEAIEANSKSFLQLAEQSFGKLQEGAQGDLEMRKLAITKGLEPVAEALKKIGADLATSEVNRASTSASLNEALTQVKLGQESLLGETGKLVTALRAPNVRGRWGEMQLKRVVEIAGMLPYCDFVEQESTRNDEGALLRPDLIIRLVGGKSLVVDAKTPLNAYLDAVASTNEAERETLLQRHAGQVRGHVQRLSQKAYWDQFQPTPDFVVMFLPGEAFFSAALQHDPSLIEFGVEQRVIPASPTTLIALLRAAAYGWREERIAESAERVSALGKELYDRLAKFAAYLATTGARLNGAVKAYNDAVGSLEGRVLVSARKFRDLGVIGQSELPALEPIEAQTRDLQAPEFDDLAVVAPDESPERAG